MENSKSLSILIVEDHDTIVSGLKYELKEKFAEIEISVAECPEKAIEIIRNKSFDIAIVDISFKNDDKTDGIELSRKIKIIKPEIKIIIYTSYADNRGYLKKLHEIDIDAIVSKNDGNFAIKYSIQKILEGKSQPHSSEVFDTLAKIEELTQKNKHILTPSEKEVLLLIHKNLTYKQIANKLCRSRNTIDSHCKNLFSKFGVNKKHLLIQKTKDILDLL